MSVNNGDATPAHERFPVDPGHAQLMVMPASMACSHPPQLQAVPGGPYMMLTVRAGMGSLSVALTKEDAKDWARHLAAAADQMSGLIVSGQMPPRADAAG